MFKTSMLSRFSVATSTSLNIGSIPGKFDVDFLTLKIVLS